MKHEMIGSTLTLNMDGNINASTADAIRKQLKEFCGGDPFKTMVMDLSDVLAIDSMGVNLLVGLYKECVKQHREFKVIGASDAIRRLFDLYKLSGYFGVQS